MSELRKEIEQAINRHSAENGSDTPDYILAEFLVGCLTAFDVALVERERWFGRKVGDWMPASDPETPELDADVENVRAAR